MPAFHRFDVSGPACGAGRGVNAADMDPPEVTCRRCLKVAFRAHDKRHYARKNGRVFVVEGFAPDPERPWKAEYAGPLS
jgi:hypothetical protein